jgi:hypothetical protein
LSVGSPVMSDYSDSAYDHEPADEAGGSRRAGPTSYVLIGLLVGLIGGFILAWVLGGNPFSRANEVVYTDVVVGSVTADADQICWAEDPDRRDSGQTCAILALDPELDVPEEGDVVTIGIVEFRTPDGSEFTQVVHVAPADVTDVDDFDPGTDPATVPDDDPSPAATP